MSTIFFSAYELGAVAKTLFDLKGGHNPDSLEAICRDLEKFSVKNAAAHAARYDEETDPCRADAIFRSARGHNRIDLWRVARSVRLFDYNLDAFRDDPEINKLLVDWLGVLLTAALDQLKAPHSLR